MSGLSSMLPGTLARYFGLRFFSATVGVFAAILVIVAMVDYMELMRRTNDVPNVSALLVAKVSLYRVPQLIERLMPFAMLIGAMSCYLNLSRRLELVIARAAGFSAWQFLAPAIVVAFVIGVVGTAAYNPVAAALHERSKRLEVELLGEKETMFQNSAGDFWVRQRSVDGQSVINAQTSREQGLQLAGVIAFKYDPDGHFSERIEAKTAVLESGHWRLAEARVYAAGTPPVFRDSYLLNTNLTPTQVRESFATPETVPFWQLPTYIDLAEQAGLGAAGYRLQYQKLLARPFFLVAMVMLAASVSLRFFRFGGVQKMVLGGMSAGFLLYVMSKVTEDLSKAELMHPVAAAWLPVLVGGFTGLVALLYQEDG
jgi:lipopolysaccharide export system permease protein